MVAVVDADGTELVRYTYDAWGKLLSTTGTMATTLGANNPLRYRGYVYDTETGLYYLQSRYYDPTVGRFVNVDGLLSTGQGLLGYNTFVYCLNQPVMYIDTTGHAAWMATAYLRQESTVGKTVYETEEDAAFMAGVLTRLGTNANDHEYICGVYKTTYGGYIIGDRYMGKHSSVPLAPVLEEVSYYIDKKLVAFVHSHPYCTGHVPNDFSTYSKDGSAMGDLACAAKYNMPIYLAAPNGELKRLYPNNIYFQNGKIYSKYSVKTIRYDLPKDTSTFNCIYWGK